MIQRQTDWEFAVTATPSGYQWVPPTRTMFPKTSELNIDFPDAHGATQTQLNGPPPTVLALILFFVSSLFTIRSFMRRAARRSLPTGGATHV